MFSIVIPTHKPKYLEETLKSIAAQNFISSYYEVLIVENPKATSRVKNIVDKFPDNFKHIECYTMGANAARNCGIKNAKYDTIVLTDDDCILDKNYLSSLKSFENHNYDMVGGPLVCKFIVEKPKWLVGGFLPHLSQVNWTPNVKIPTDLSVINSGYLVSANLSFSKTLYGKIGPFEEEHGYIGSGLFANDEVRFINRARKFGVLYNPEMKMEHIIDSSRVKIEYFIQRKYAQGYVDAILYLEDKNATDLYNGHLEWRLANTYSYAESHSVREEIKDEEVMRQWVRYKILTESAYNLGFIHKLEGKERCENACALLMDVQEQNLFSRA